MKHVIIALAALIGSLAALGAAAAPVASAHAKTELVAETTGVAPGSTVWIATAQTFDKGWHSYWRNPGDAGEATSIKWTLPTGWRAGEIVWPTPRRLPVGPTMNYGYEDGVILATPVQIPADAKVGQSVTVAAVVNFLVCAEVCVPDTATVSLALPVVAGNLSPDPVWSARIAQTLAAAPKSGGLAAVFTTAGGVLKLAISGAALAGAADMDAYFYPFDGALIDHAKPQAVERGPGGMTLTLTAGSAFAKGPGPAAAGGVLTVDGKAYEIAAKPGALPAAAGGLGAPHSGAGGLGLALATLFAFLGGVILNLMPCVFPILSMKAVALTTHRDDPANLRRQALAFLAGVLATFVALAAVLIAARAAGTAVGWGFQLQSPAVVAVLALVMLAAALNLSGLFEIGTSAQGLGAGLAARGGAIGSVMTGVLAVVVAAPCTAPFMGPALGFALTQSAVTALLVFVALGLGFAAPFILLAFSPGLLRRLPKPGAWMDLFRKAMAFPMYAAAAWLIWVIAQQTDSEGLARVLAAAVVLALAAWLYGLARYRQGLAKPTALAFAFAAGAAATAIGLVGARPFAPPPHRTGAVAFSDALASRPWSPETLAALRAQGRPMFVNFTAAWCVTCQVNERVAFSSPTVAAAFKRSGTVYLVADWTNRDGAIAKALAEQGRIGVPLYLVYPAKGGPPRVLPQLLTPAIVVEALDP